MLYFLRFSPCSDAFQGVRETTISFQFGIVITEAFAIAIQDQVVATNNYKKVILNEADVVDRCRKCDKNNEAIVPIINGCGKLVTKTYKARHHDVKKIIHQEIRKRVLGNADPMEPCYK